MCARILTSILLLAGAASLAWPAENLFEPDRLPRLELRFRQPDWWDQLLANKATGEFLRADLTVDDTDYPEVGVRFHGRSSFSPHIHSRKLPFWISIDHYRPRRELHGRRTLILKNSYLDPSLLREALAFRILSEYLPSPRAGFVVLGINGESWGVYVNVELPDREFLERWFPDATGPIHIGEGPFLCSRLVKDGCDDLFPRADSRAPGVCGEIGRMLAVKDTADTTRRRRVLPALLDIDQILRHMAAETAIGHTDGFPGNNYTLYLDPSDWRFRTIPWDYNLSFQFADLLPAPPRQGVLTDPVWYRRYLGYVRTIVETSLDWGAIGPWVRSAHQLIAEEVRADTKSLYSYEAFLTNATTEVVLPDSTFSRPGLKEFVEARQEWLAESGLARNPRVSLAWVEPSVVTSGSTTTGLFSARTEPGTSAARVTLHLQVGAGYRELEMRDDGENGDREAGDGVFTAGTTLPLGVPTVTYHFSAEASTGDISFLPASGGFRPYDIDLDEIPEGRAGCE